MGTLIENQTQYWCQEVDLKWRKAVFCGLNKTPQFKHIIKNNIYSLHFAVKNSAIYINRQQIFHLWCFFVGKVKT